MSIKEWLDHENPSYQKGIELLKASGEKDIYIKMLSMGISKANLATLRARLELAAQKLPPERPTEGKPDVNDPQYIYKQLKLVNKNEFSRVYRLFQNNLTEDKDEKTRYEAARQIVDAFDNIINPTYRQVRQFEETGQLPDDHYLKANVQGTWVDIKQQILNLRTYVSRSKKDPHKQADVLRWQSQILQLEKELDAIQKQ